MWASSTISHIPANADDAVVRAGDEVLRQAVRLELAAVGVGRPRRVEAGPLDVVDGGRSSILIGSIRILTGGRATMPPPRSSVRDPARQGHILGDEPREVVDVAVRRRSAPAASSSPASPARAGSPSTIASSGARPSRSTRHQPRAGRQRGLRASRQQLGRDALADQHPVRRAGRAAAGARAFRRAAPRAAARSATPVAIPTIGRPRPWASVFAVAIPTRRPVNAPGPVPTTIAAVARPFERRGRPGAARPPAAASPRGGSRPATSPPRARRRRSCPARRRSGSSRCRARG